MIHFDFDGRYQDELIVGNAISRREGVVWSVVAHVVLFSFLLLLPRLGLFEPSAEELEQQRLERLARLEREREEPRRFVLMEPRRDVPAERPRERVDLSDIDRRSTTVERAPAPENPSPASRGNTPERVEAAPPASEPKGEEAPPEPQRQPEQQVARNTPPVLPRQIEPQRPPGSIIGDAVKNLEQYARNQTFDNPQGGNTDRSESIQFDSKGVNFGPWLRRFVSQVRRNWFVPLSAMTFRGHVVLQFYIHRDGRITDVNIVQPSDIDSFNRSAYNAITGSNPTEPLPAEYPDDKALFTVTFYYNERPPGS